MSPLEMGGDLQWLIDEHKQLKALIESERSWWQEIREIGKPRFGEMGSRLAHLKTQLAAHFAHEESAEHEAVKRAVCKASPEQITQLQDEHRDFLARLENMIAKANDSGSSYASWGDLGLEFSELIHAIDEHESEELRLLTEILGRMEPSKVVSAV